MAKPLRHVDTCTADGTTTITENDGTTFEARDFVQSDEQGRYEAIHENGRRIWIEDGETECEWGYC